MMADYIGRLLELLSDIFMQALYRPWQRAQAAVFHSKPNTPRIRRPKHKSIVRLIGTYLPLPKAPRVHLNLAAWNNFSNDLPALVVTHEDQLTGSDEHDIVPKEITHKDSCEAQAAIKSLQEELQQLRLQIAAILENQSNAVKDDDRADVFTDDEDIVKPLTSSRSAPPPPPPPPPPPFPPAALTTSNSLPILKKEKSNTSFGSTTNTAPSTLQILDQVLTEMKNGRPKLKPVQRSPGGRPIKPSKPKTDPSDVLTEVLRRRFSVAQMSDTNDSDTSSHTDAASSPDWKTFVT